MRLLFLVLMGLLPFSINAKEIKLTSFNLGLAHSFVAHAQERTPHLINALTNQDSDILCVQEVWTKKDQKSLVKALKEKYPYVHKSTIKQVKAPKRGICKYSDLFGDNRFVTCMQTKCKGKTGDDLTQCVIKDCRSPMEWLKDNNRFCAQALMAQVGKNKIISILTLLNPLAKPGLFTYKGSVGTLLFSKYPFVKEKTGFEDWGKYSTTTKRGLLYATVRPSQKEIFISCNHISANLSQTVPYTGPFKSWAEENLFQAQRTIDFANSVAPTSPQFIMGDFNCGFASDNVLGEFEESCLKFPNQGYATPLPKLVDSCTFCGSNTLINNSKANHMIDHIFTKNTEEALSAEILFKEIVPIKNKEGEFESNLSDHFGVSVKIDL